MYRVKEFWSVENSAATSSAWLLHTKRDGKKFSPTYCELLHAKRQVKMLMADAGCKKELKQQRQLNDALTQKNQILRAQLDEALWSKTTDDFIEDVREMGLDGVSQLLGRVFGSWDCTAEPQEILGKLTWPVHWDELCEGLRGAGASMLQAASIRAGLLDSDVRPCPDGQAERWPLTETELTWPDLQVINQAKLL